MMFGGIGNTDPVELHGIWPELRENACLVTSLDP
jgi:hypothetical protein